MADDCPVDQVFGMQDGQRGKMAKTGGRHVIVCSNPDDIWVGIIGVDDWVAVAVIAQVRVVDGGLRKNDPLNQAKQHCDTRYFRAHYSCFERKEERCEPFRIL